MVGAYLVTRDSLHNLGQLLLLHAHYVVYLAGVWIPGRPIPDFALQLPTLQAMDFIFDNRLGYVQAGILCI